MGKIERMQKDIKKQMQAGVADEYNKHLEEKSAMKSEHMESLSQILEEKLENF